MMMTEIDLLLENAQLRNEIEPYQDESLVVVDLDRMSTRVENEYLASLLDWERAPVLPISHWFEPALEMPPHATLSDDELRQQLHQVIGRLYEKNVVLLSTDHLSDRQLYCLIARDILPSPEKKLVRAHHYLEWQCLDPDRDEESWLRFYASDVEREQWAMEYGLRLPPRETPPFPRRLPTAE